MKRYALIIMFCALSASATFAQTKNPIEGVWRVAEVVTPPRNPGEAGTTVTSPQPGLIIFTKGYYSAVVVTSAEPRPAAERPKDPQNPTDAEKLALYAQWRPFVANAGTYEVKGSTIVRRPMVAKNVGVMSREEPSTHEFKMEGPNTLWFVPTGDQAAREPKIKLTRVE